MAVVPQRCPLILRSAVVNSFDATLALSVFHVLAVYGSGLNRKRYLDLKGMLKCDSRGCRDVPLPFFNSHANFSRTFLAY